MVTSIDLVFPFKLLSTVCIAVMLEVAQPIVLAAFHIAGTVADFVEPVALCSASLVSRAILASGGVLMAVRNLIIAALRSIDSVLRAIDLPIDVQSASPNASLAEASCLYANSLPDSDVTSATPARG